MSLESAIADLVSASTSLTQAVNITKATVEATRDSAIAKEAPVTTAKDAVLASTTAASTGAATTAAKLTAAAADYAAQKTTKGLAAVQTSADSELKDRLHRRDPARHPFRGARPSLVMDFVRRECHRNNAAGNLEPVDLSTFMTFTRESTATYVGPDGLIKTAGVNEARYGYDPVTGEALGLLVEEQRTNLFPYSSYPASASVAKGWNRINCDVYPNVAMAPDGTMTAAKAVVSVGASTTGNDGVGVFAAPGVTSSATHTLTLYVKDAGAGYLRVRESITTGEIAKVNLTTGAITAEAGYTTATFTVTATNVGNGWWRVAVVRTPTTTFGFNLKPGIDVGDGVSGIYVWGAQVEAGAFPTSYIPTPATFTGRASTKTYFDSNGVLQTAASGVAATDYGYVDGRWVSKGLSLEPQATNLLTYSGTLTDGSWGKTNAASVSGATLSFVGGMSRIIKTVTAPDGTYTLSARFSLADVGKKIKLAVWYDGKDGFSYADSTIPESGVVTTTVNATGITNVGIINSSAGTAQSVTLYPGTGIQFEAGPVATSYIPTTAAQVTRAADTSTSAQVTRAADNAVSTQAAALYNLDAGTTCVEAKYSNRGTYPGLYSWNNDYFIFTATAVNQLILNGRGSAGTMGLTPPAVDTTLRHAVRRNRLNLKSAVNNSALTGASLSLSPTTTVTMLRLGVGTEYWNGYIRQLTYFPRQLSDADLQALTILED